MLRILIGIFVGFVALTTAAAAQPATKVFRVGILSNVPLEDPQGRLLWDEFMRGLDIWHHGLHMGLWYWRPTLWWRPKAGVSQDERAWLAGGSPVALDGVLAELHDTRRSALVPAARAMHANGAVRR